MEGTISYKEMYEVLRKVDQRGVPVPFSIHFVTRRSSRKGQASKHVRLEKAVTCGARHSLTEFDQIGVRPVGGGHQYSVGIDLILSINNRLVG